MAKGNQIIQVLTGLLLVGAFGWFIYTIGASVLSGLASLESDIAVAIVAASASIVVSALSLVGSKYLERRSSELQEIRKRKVPVYEELISTLFGVLFAEKAGRPKPSEQELMQFFADFTEKLVVWGSDGVISKFSEFRTAPLRDVPPMELMFLYEELLLEIRKDLGHRNTSVKKGTLLSLFINDIHKYIPKKAA